MATTYIATTPPVNPPQLFRDELWNGREYVTAFIHISGIERGPAIGGCRIHHYSRLSEAEANVQQLSESMRLKSALAEVPFGGGKAVLVTNPVMAAARKKELLKNFVMMVNELGGAYITAEDTGTNIKDMEFIAKHTPYVVGTSLSGNPSPITAYGVYQGLKACLREKGIDSLEGLTIALKGAGSVAEALVFGFPKNDERFDEEIRREFPGLLQMGVKKIHYADKDVKRAAYFKKRARELGLGNKLKSHFPVAESNEIYAVEGMDVFVPAAARYSASGEFISLLAKAGCKVIAGCENNQLRYPTEDSARIQEAGIVYAPDFAINAGGLINVAEEYASKLEKRLYDAATVLRKTAKIEDTIAEILAAARKSGRTTLGVAQALAEERIPK